MAVLIPRIHTLGVRLTEDEYSSLERFCVESGARSISDLARTAICSYLSRGHQENALTSIVNQTAVQAKEMRQEIEMLSAEVALLRAISAERDGDKNREVQGDLSLSVPNSPPDKKAFDPGL